MKQARAVECEQYHLRQPDPFVEHPSESTVIARRQAYAQKSYLILDAEQGALLLHEGVSLVVALALAEA